LRPEMTEDITQIRVGQHPVGIIGLRGALAEVGKEFGARFDDAIGEELLTRLRKTNYIPDGARESYKSSFLREYRKFLGEEIEEGRPEGLEVRILGQGCTQCDKLAQELMVVISEAGLVGDVLHVRDLKEIGKYGVMSMPALVVNGKVKCVGRVPSRGQILLWLKEAARKGQ
jgi:hypothetical protein